MLWVPAERSLFVRTAEPLESATPTHPEILVPPSLNVTEPIGVPPADAVTFAVKVTESPYVLGLLLLVIAVAVIFLKCA